MAKKIDYANLYTLRKDGRYMGSYTDDKGRHFVYDKDPEKLYKKLQAIANSEKPVITFKEVAEAWKVEHVEKLARNSQHAYDAPLRKAIAESGHLPIDKVDAAEINRIILEEKKQDYGYGHASILKSVYKQVLDYAIINRYITYNPALHVTIPRGMKQGKIESPETEVVETIVKNLHKPFGDFVAMLLYTGMRTEEAAALMWSDIDFKNEIIHVRRAVDLHGTPIIKGVKTKASLRDIPILPPLKPFLNKPDTDGYVFNIDGKLLTRSQIYSRWVNWCRSAGLAYQVIFKNRLRNNKLCDHAEWRTHVTPHQLRHHYATILFEAGIDELTAADIMGHEDIRTTRTIYTSLRKTHRESEIEKLKAFFY